MANLRNDSINITPTHIDWIEERGEDGENWRAVEVVECHECEREFVTTFLGEEQHRYAQDTLTLDKLPEAGAKFSCLACNKKFIVELNADGDEFDCPHCSENHYDGVEIDNTCIGDVSFEGPMMNYWYKLPHFDRSIEDAAKDIAHLPLCFVEFSNGDIGLALTGGGMDLSWEICAAFIALGYAPPLHFCDLPRMAGKHRESHWREVVAGCMRTAKVAAGWAERQAKDLARLYDELDAESDGAA